VEDIHGLMLLATKAPKAQLMAVYYTKLVKVFWMGGGECAITLGWLWGPRSFAFPLGLYRSSLVVRALGSLSEFQRYTSCAVLRCGCAGPSIESFSITSLSLVRRPPVRKPWWLPCAVAGSAAGCRRGWAQGLPAWQRLRATAGPWCTTRTPGPSSARNLQRS